MGMYTELVLGLDLKDNTPKPVMDMLRVLIKDCKSAKDYQELYWEMESLLRNNIQFFDSEFFYEDNRKLIMFSSGSNYFPGALMPILLDEDYWMDDDLPHDDKRNYHFIRKTFSCYSNFKNYGREIQQLLNWIAPFCNPIGYVGHVRYETELFPTFIYMNVGKNSTTELHYLPLTKVFNQVNADNFFEKNYRTPDEGE